MIQWNAQTRAIIDAHNKDFNSANFPTELKTAAGFKGYLENLGGVFALYGEKNANVQTVTEFQRVAEFVFGVMAVYGFDYDNGTTRHRWGKIPTPDAFYLGSAKGKCNWGELSELCTVKAKTTNCNYFVDTLFIKAGLFTRSGFHNSCDVPGLVKAFGFQPIREKSALRVGDLVEMYRKPLTGAISDWRKNSDWYHVAVVGEITETEIILYDGGSRFVNNRQYKYAIPKTGDAIGGTYASGCGGWCGIRVRNLIEDGDKMQKVIDLSEHNTTSIDWAKVKAAGYWVLLRMGLRGSMKAYPDAYGKIRLDNHFEEYLSGVKKAGIPYGVYWFPTPINDAEAAEEAEYIIKALQRFGISLSMPVFLDSEMVDKGNGRADKLTKDARTHLLRVMLDRLEAAGVPCGVYASTEWLEKQLEMADLPRNARVNTWVAQYASKCTYSGIYSMWQYTSKASVPGIPGNVDASVITGDFFMQKNEKTYSRETYVDKAASYIGTVAGSAKHKDLVDTYNAYGAAHGYPRNYKVRYNDAWCALFVSAIAIKCGYTAIIPVECGCPQMIALAKAAGIWTENDAYTPKKGDLILYDWDDNGSGDNVGTPDHIGIVETVDGSKITVIEGNFNDAVRRRTLSINGKYIRGFITPKYTAAAVEQLVSVTASYRVLRKGMKGADVLFMQAVIGAKPDGDFRDKTFERLVEYQKEKGAATIGKPDGVCGRKSWACIIADARK